jgi:hypothetical protein
VVAVTASLIAPVIPNAAAVRAGPVGRVRGPLPVAALETSLPAVVDTVYALSAVDKSGRVTDRSLVRALGWAPGTRLDVRERAGIIVVRSVADGVDRVSATGFVKVPLAVRRWCRIRTGDRVLLAGDPTGGVLVIYPLVVVHARLGGDVG